MNCKANDDLCEHQKKLHNKQRLLNLAAAAAAGGAASAAYELESVSNNHHHRHQSNSDYDQACEFCEISKYLPIHWFTDDCAYESSKSNGKKRRKKRNTKTKHKKEKNEELTTEQI